MPKLAAHAGALTSGSGGRRLVYGSLLGLGLLLVYLAAMPLAFPKSGDGVEWSKRVESSLPTWQGRRLLAWPLEKAWYESWRPLGYHGQAFVPMEVLHALLGACAVAAIVWLLLQRGVAVRIAALAAVNLGLSFAIFDCATDSYLHLPSSALGVIAVVAALGGRPDTLKRPLVLGLLALLAALAVLLQLTGVVFPLVLAVVLALRLPFSPRRRLLTAGVVGLVSLALVGATYAAVWHLALSDSDRSMPFSQWLTYHPQAASLHTGSHVTQALRAISGLRAAFSGPSAVTDMLKVSLLRQGGQPHAGVWDWVAFLAGSGLLVLGGVISGACVLRRETRTDGAVIVSVVVLTGLTALPGFGSDAWYWVATLALVWYAIGLWSSVGGRARRTVTMLLCLAVLFNTVTAYRAIAVPSLLVRRGGPMAERVLAYSRASRPDDLLIAKASTDCQILSYSLHRPAVSLFLLSYGEGWREKVLEAIATVPSGSRIFLGNDVINPTDADTLQDWLMMAQANGMARSEAIRLLQSQGHLRQLNGVLPGEPLWELQRTARSR